MASAPNASPLVRAFLAGQARPPADPPRLVTALNAALEHVTWLTSADHPALAQALGARAPALEAEEALAALHVDDLALAIAVSEGRRPALEAFERLLTTEVRRAVASVDPSPSFSDEVSQQMRHQLLLPEPGQTCALLGYSARGPLAKWLRVSALRLGLKLRTRAEPTVPDDEALLDLPAADGGPELDFLRGKYRLQFREAFAAAFHVLSAHERNILRLHYLEGVSFVQLAVQFGLHRTTVAKQLELARQTLFDETRRLVSERLQLSRDDFEGLIAALRSQLDVSIRRFLKTEPSPSK